VASAKGALFTGRAARWALPPRVIGRSYVTSDVRCVLPTANHRSTGLRNPHCVPSSRVGAAKIDPMQFALPGVLRWAWNFTGRPLQPV
jgi:hypothetical protein